jgi:hypothetical protein
LHSCQLAKIEETHPPINKVALISLFLVTWLLLLSPELDSAINAKPAEAAELVVCFVHNNYYVVHTY